MTPDVPVAINELVVLTVDSESYCLTTVDLAVDMAASLRTRIQGLFIEDEDLVRIAGLPFTREIAFPSARERTTDADIMQRSLRAMATQFKTYLEKSAQASQVQWSYDYVQGCSRKVGLIASPGVIYTIVGQTIYRRPQPVNYRRARKLLVVEDHSPHIDNAMDVVLRSFGDAPVEVTLINSDHQNATTNTTKTHLNLAQKNHMTVVELPHSKLSQVLADTSTVFDYAIISRNESPDSLSEIFKHLRCTVILVS